MESRMGLVRHAAWKRFGTALVYGLVLLAGCSNLPTEEEGEATDQLALEDFDFPGPIDQSLGAWTSIAWPFVGDHPNNWRNWNCENYPCGGAMGNWCGAYIHSHSGADHYARDLSRTTGPTAGRSVHAGFSGRVVYVGPYGAGTSVVLYYPSQRVCIRYAHLGEVAVQRGQYVTIRQYLGKILNQGSNSHLHLVAYENVPAGSNGYPAYIPGLCHRDNWHSCRVFFFS